MLPDALRITPEFARLLSPVQTGPAAVSPREPANPARSVFISGRRGRIGAELERLAALNGIAVSDDPKTPVHLIARSWKEADAYLRDLDPAITAVDLSGALKARGLGRYGLIVGGETLAGGLPRPGERIANNGCMASAVILALREAGLGDAAYCDGPLHVTVAGSAAMASRASEGSLRTGNKWSDHPHVAEIERALPGTKIASFVPTIAYGQPRGLLAVVSGKLSSAGAAAFVARGTDAAPDVKEVLGTARLAIRSEREGSYFTLAAAADNITLPAANAILLASALLGE